MYYIQVILKEKLRRSKWAPLARALYAAFNNPKVLMLLFSDYVEIFYKLSGFRNSFKKIERNINVSNKKLIIVSFGTIYSTKLESILAAPLMMEGWLAKVFIRNKGTYSQRLYYWCFGIDKIIFGAEIDVVMPSKIELQAIKNKLLIACNSIGSLKKFEFRNVNIGVTLITSLQRQDLIANFQPNNPEVRQKIFDKLNEVIRWVLVCQKMIELEKPNTILLIEANDWNRPLVDIAINSKVDVIQVIQPSEDDGLIFKRINSETRGIHPNSISKKILSAPIKELDWEEQLQDQLMKRYDGSWSLQSRNQPGVIKVNREYINNELGLDIKKKNVIIFSHILWDANLFYGEDLFEGYGDWLVNTIKNSIKNTQVNWIIKLHPANLWKRKFESVRGEYSEITLLKEHQLWPLPAHIKLLYPECEISTDSLFAIADYGITVRGTVGVELPCYGIRTFTAGTGRYSGLGFTEDFNTRGQFITALENIEQYPLLDAEAIKLAKKHAYLLFCKRSWKFSAFKVVQGELSAKNPLAYNIKLNQSSFEKKLESKEFETWKRWFLDPAKPIEYMQINVE